MPQSGRATVFIKPYKSQTIVGVPCLRQLSPARISGDLHSGRRAHQQERVPLIYLPGKPRRKTITHALTRADLRPGAEIHTPMRGGACDTVFTHASSSRCVCCRQAHPSTTRAPPLPEKPFFFIFFSSATVTSFFCRRNLHFFLCFLELYDIFRTLGVVFVNSYLFLISMA